jgi:ABC-type polysaccharide/polyol phosphate export permease
LLRPILLTIILCVVFQRLFRRSDLWTYAPYLLSGLCCWDYIVTATKTGCHCFFQGESYLRQHPAPIAIFPLRVALAETFHFLVALLVLVLTVWAAQGFANVAVLFSLVPTLVLLFALAWALGLIAGCLNVYFQDTQHLCDVGFQILFYATPIVYAPADLGNGRLHWVVTHCNPLVPFLDLLREPLLEARLPALQTYAAACLVVLVLGGLASFVCARWQRRLIFHL